MRLVRLKNRILKRRARPERSQGRGEERKTPLKIRFVGLDIGWWSLPEVFMCPLLQSASVFGHQITNYARGGGVTIHMEAISHNANVAVVAGLGHGLLKSVD